MSEPYIGDIRMFAGTFAPLGYLFCQGQILAISEYNTLYTLIGTTYGGDGQTTFGLPDLRGRVPVHAGPTLALGQSGGDEQVTLTNGQLPIHTHPVEGTKDAATASSPSGKVLAAAANNLYLADAEGGVALSSQSSGVVGGGQPHSNLQPYLCINFIIATEGQYPQPPS